MRLDPPQATVGRRDDRTRALTNDKEAVFLFVAGIKSPRSATLNQPVWYENLSVAN